MSSSAEVPGTIVDATPRAASDDSIPTESAAALKPKKDINTYLHRSVHNLLSLEGRTIVITGGARGLGLAFAFAVAEVGGNVAIIDALDTPHEHFYKLEKDFGVKVKLYKSDVTKFPVLKATFDQIVADFERIDGL